MHLSASLKESLEIIPTLRASRSNVRTGCPENGGFAWEVSLFLALGGSGFWELFWSRFWIDFEVDFGVVLEPFLEPILVSF